MIFIEKSDLDDYRYAVGKVVFLKVYNNEYKLIKDIENSNCMVVENLERNQLIISLFRKPTVGKKKRALPTLVYYQNSSRINKNNQRVLSVTFTNLYDESIILAILRPGDFIDRFSNYRSLIGELIMNSFVAKDTSGTLFKYYSSQIQGNTYKTLDGMISFMHPSRFNDPFDCFIGIDEKNKDKSHKLLEEFFYIKKYADLLESNELKITKIQSVEKKLFTVRKKVTNTRQFKHHSFLYKESLNAIGEICTRDSSYR